MSLYQVLNLTAAATAQEIRSSYKNLALQLHPDKALDKQSAKSRFIKVTQAYKVLSDPQRRRNYDETGLTGDQKQEQIFQNAYKYFRTIFKKVQLADIQKFQEQFRGSLLEREDLLAFYRAHKGDLTLLLEHIIASRNQDIPRFRKLFEQAIEKGQIESYKAFQKCKIRKLKIEKDEANFDLVKAIRENQARREALPEPKPRRRK